jgi:hypothetical protein
LAILRVAPLPKRLAFLAVALPYSARAIVPKTKMRHIKLRHRDTNEIATPTANHLAVRHILTQILPDPAADYLSKPLLIPLNFHDHGS